MKIYHLSDDIPKDRYALALGNFDGVHTAHSALIESAKKFGGKCAVFTFSKLRSPSVISEQKRARLFEELGVDTLFLADFDTVKDMEYTDFFNEILIKKIGVYAVFCGFNFRFGKGAAGHACDLEVLCKDHSIFCHVMPKMTLDSLPISSSAIRASLSQGDVERATRLLGRQFSIEGSVIHGKALASKLGFPTVNTALDPRLVIPKFGVYVTTCQVDSKVYPSITNVGIRPTFDDETPTAETYLLCENIDLYGKKISVSFCKFIRPEMRFESAEALSAQVRLDIEKARQHFNL